MGDTTPYGSDFGEDGESLLAELLDEAELLRGESPLGLAYVGDEHHHAALAPLHALPRLSGELSLEARRIRQSLESQPDGQLESQVDLAANPVDSGPTDAPLHKQVHIPSESPAPAEDTRSPLERFRTAPKKPLSVTDLVSPAWCELQYWFSLTKYGRVRQTAAMKRGSTVHKVLEEQVHQVVPIDVQTREDNWGLKLWNVIQGLRTLRATGMTRELEVYGTVDGLVVTGIIDELSYTSTDPALEAKLAGSDRKRDEPPPDQTTIQDFFKGRSSAASNGQSGGRQTHDKVEAMSSKRSRSQKVYLTDVKTRNHKSLPKGPSFRGTEMQLMLYRRLLASLVNNDMDAEIIFERFGVSSSRPFSDSLIAQLSGLDLNLSTHADEGSVNPIESEDDAMDELLAHNNLGKLWSLMVQEYQLALPNGPGSLSPVLQAEFRAAQGGHIIGSKTFAYDHERIEKYVAEEIRWWRGDRPARGVDVEEAFKCGICEFADTCSWRLHKIEEATGRSRVRGNTQAPSPG